MASKFRTVCTECVNTITICRYKHVSIVAVPASFTPGYAYTLAVTVITKRRSYQE